jgi:hypothetical protein
LATLAATVVHLQARAVDDCLELFDLLMVTELLGKAERRSDKEKLRQHPGLAHASAKLAAAVKVLFEPASKSAELNAAELWEAAEPVVPRSELQAAVSTIGDLVPEGSTDDDDDGAVRAALVARMATVNGFVRTMTKAIRHRAAAPCT